MKWVIFFAAVVSFSLEAKAKAKSQAKLQSEKEFVEKAQVLAKDLKMSLKQNLMEQLQKNGTEAAVSFCHENVRPIAKDAAGKRVSEFEFGRTSHKTRNPRNTPQEWMKPYLERLKGKAKAEVKDSFFVVKGNVGVTKISRAYLEPLFMEAQCLLCHGEMVAPEVAKKINEKYPEDKAIGFKLDEFRGFVWVREKEKSSK